MVELGLPLHFAFEADGLYSRLGNTFYYPFIANELDIRTIANSWQFPLLAKYYLPVRRLPLYLSTGLAIRHAGGEIHTIHYGFYPSDITFSKTDWSADDRALVLGGGMRFRFGHIRVSPEIRYSWWHIPSNPSARDVAHYLPTAHRYEAQFLVGLGWH